MSGTPLPAEAREAVAALRRSYRRVALAHFLAAVAVLIAVGGFGYQTWVYQSHRGQNLDIPEWLAINLDLTIALAPVILFGGLLNVVSLMAYCARGGKAGWLAGAAFGLSWSLSVFFVGLLVYSRLPIAF